MKQLLIALALTGSMSLAATTTQDIQYKTTDPKELRDLTESLKTSQDFVELLDQENFGSSWSRASTYFKMTIDQAGWQEAMSKLRKPLGKTISREIADQRTSKDPENLPKGDYMVVFYRTSFANKKAAYELVTLVKEDGQWKVLTYQVN